MLKEEKRCADLDWAAGVYLRANSQARAHVHERVWLCDSCQRAPAAFMCKADAASLCAACDSDIHSANPLAQRHHRVPILPLPGSLAADPGGGASLMITHTEEPTMDEEDEDEAASWLLLNPAPPAKNNNSSSQGGNYGGEIEDEYLDLMEYSSCQDNQFSDEYSINHQQHYSVPHKNMSYDGDRVVPSRGTNQHYRSFQQYDNSNPGYAYPSSITHSVSISSFDLGVVPESTISDASFTYSRPTNGTIDLLCDPPVQMPPQLTPMDREARVLRYREKKKTRKFEKTIRYASRKAYAETRPRIKGRFAKRNDAETEEDQIFSRALMAEGGYGIVPSF